MCEHCVHKFCPKKEYIKHLAKLEQRFGYKNNCPWIGDPIDTHWIEKSIRRRNLRNRKVNLLEEMGE
jgi:hypothetical protein